MKKDVILKVENISKQYRLGTIGTGTISHDLNRWWHIIRGKEDPYLKIGETNDRSTTGNSEYAWALKDISFEVERGEVLGIIGKNGAGKSTLLKILSKVTGPTTGEIKTKGRIASLLEVGTGFHPEMTGKENIFLNGAILGMTKAEINVKLDEIIDFSGCQRYIDTPVKRYSSGMKVRLAFAVAAFLEPDILVVDEVLAVGDAEFQKKAIGKMQDISKGDGRTVLFVSHNMAAVKNLCTRGVVLKHGKVVFNGGTEDAINNYLDDNKNTKSLSEIKDRKGSKVIMIDDVEVYGKSKSVRPQTGEPFSIKLELNNKHKISSQSIHCDIRIDDHLGQRIAWMSNRVINKIDNVKEASSLSFSMEKLSLNKGVYYVTIFLTVNNDVSDWIENAFSFEVVEGDYYRSGKKVSALQSKVLLDFKISFSV